MYKVPRVRPGQRIFAQHINAIADAASAGLNNGHGTRASNIPGGRSVSLVDVFGQKHPATIINVCNRSIQTVHRASIMMMTNVTFTGGLYNRTIVSSMENYQTGNEDKVVVATEDIRPNHIGRAVISGVCYAAVHPDSPTITPSRNLRASPVTQNPYRRYVLISSDGIGTWPVISVVTNPWDETDTKQYALIQIGGGAAPSSLGDNWQFVWNEGGEG